MVVSVLSSIYGMLKMLVYVVIGAICVITLFKFKDFEKRPIEVIRQVMSLGYLTANLLLAFAVIGLIVAVLTGDKGLFIESIAGVIVTYLAREFGLPFLRWFLARVVVGRMPREELEEIAVGKIYEEIG